MPMVNQPNNRTLLRLLVGVMLVCLMWVGAPRMYVATTKLLPAGWISQVNPSEQEAARQIARLRAQLSRLQSKNRQLRIKASGQSITSSTTTLPTNFSSARVLARPPQTPYDVLLINAGRNQGVTTGAVVWWPPGVYLGNVIEARNNNSLVRLTSSAQVHHVGRIENRLTTTVIGRGGGAMTATVPTNANIATGTVVISDRWGVPFARVVEQQPAAGLAKQRLFLQSIVPASVIENVYVSQE